MTQNLVLDGPFERPKKRLDPGVLYSRVWRAPFTNGLTDTWRRRCNEYWERVEQRFGVVVSEPRHAWYEDPETGPIVATYATVLGVLKGDRYDKPESERVN